jgi:hypothetical protein
MIGVVVSLLLSVTGNTLIRMPLEHALFSLARQKMRQSIDDVSQKSVVETFFARERTENALRIENILNSENPLSLI